MFVEPAEVMLMVVPRAIIPGAVLNITEPALFTRVTTVTCTFPTLTTLLLPVAVTAHSRNVMYVFVVVVHVTFKVVLASAAEQPPFPASEASPAGAQVGLAWLVPLAQQTWFRLDRPVNEILAPAFRKSELPPVMVRAASVAPIMARTNRGKIYFIDNVLWFHSVSQVNPRPRCVCLAPMRENGKGGAVSWLPVGCFDPASNQRSKTAFCCFVSERVLSEKYGVSR